MKMMEMPEPGTDAAKALLAFESEGVLSADDFDGQYNRTVRAVEELRGLGWPFRELPRDGRDLRANVQDTHYGIPVGSGYDEDRKAAADRLRSRAYLEWRAEALAALTGQVVAKAAAPRVVTDQPFTAADFTGMAGSRLAMPLANQPQSRVVFSLMHLRAATPETCGLKSARFAAATISLRKDGWPIAISVAPLSATWAGVDDDVLAAWRTAYGDRGMRDALEEKSE